MRIYLDDVRNPQYPDNFTLIVRTPEHFKALFKKWGSHITYVSFDHDLGPGDTETGHDLARWILNMWTIHGNTSINPRMEFGVHSANPVGAENIRGTLGKYFKESYGRPKVSATIPLSFSLRRNT